MISGQNTYQKIIKDADKNFQNAWTLLVQASQKGEVIQQDELLITNCNMSIPMFNRIFLDLDTISHAQSNSSSVDSAIHYFQEQKLPFELCVKKDLINASKEPLDEFNALEVLARKYNLKKQLSYPGMVLTDLSGIHTPHQGEKPNALEVVHVKNLSMLDDFKKVNALAYNIPMKVADRLLTPSLLENSFATLFITYDGNKAVAASMLIKTDNVAGIYWVGTHPDHRCKGHGTAVTQRAIEDGREMGCTIASLQASEHGETMYHKMGFTTPIQYNIWSGKPTQ